MAERVVCKDTFIEIRSIDNKWEVRGFVYREGEARGCVYREVLAVERLYV